MGISTIKAIAISCLAVVINTYLAHRPNHFAQQIVRMQELKLIFAHDSYWLSTGKLPGDDVHVKSEVEFRVSLGKNRRTLSGKTKEFNSFMECITSGCTTAAQIKAYIKGSSNSTLFTTITWIPKRNQGLFNLLALLRKVTAGNDR